MIDRQASARVQFARPRPAPSFVVVDSRFIQRLKTHSPRRSRPGAPFSLHAFSNPEVAGLGPLQVLTRSSAETVTEHSPHTRRAPVCSSRLKVATSNSDESVWQCCACGIGFKQQAPEVSSASSRGIYLKT